MNASWVEEEVYNEQGFEGGGDIDQGATTI